MGVRSDLEIGEGDDLWRQRQKHFAFTLPLWVHGFKLSVEFGGIDGLRLCGAVAAKVLTIAGGRRGGAPDALSADSSTATVAGGAVRAESMLLRSARFFACDKAGRRRAARTAMMATTTNSSMRVKARERCIIRDLVGWWV